MGDVVERAIDPEAHPQAGLHRLEVNVARPLGRRPRDDPFNQGDRRSLADLVVQVELRARQVDDHHAAFILIVGNPLVAVVAVERGEDLGLERDHGLNAAARRKAKVIDRMQVLGTRDGDHQCAAHLQQGEGHMLAGNFLRKHPHCLGVDRVGVNPRGGETELGAQGFEDGVGGHIAQLDQDLAEAATGTPMSIHGGAELLRCDQFALDENLAERRDRRGLLTPDRLRAGQSGSRLPDEKLAERRDGRGLWTGSRVRAGQSGKHVLHRSRLLGHRRWCRRRSDRVL